MTVKELIEELKKHQPEAEVRVGPNEVTGLFVESSEGDNIYDIVNMSTWDEL